ncbi:AGAP008710-PA, partial [Anopheles gambiae str. PEST]
IVSHAKAGAASSNLYGVSARQRRILPGTTQISERRAFSLPPPPSSSPSPPPPPPPTPPIAAPYLPGKKDNRAG